MAGDGAAGSTAERRRWKEALGLFFSLAALLISAASFYFSNLRVDDNTLVRVTDLETAEDETGEIQSIVLVASFINAGNRPSIVTRAGYAVGSGDKTSLFGQFADDAFPLVLPPRDLRLLRLAIPVFKFGGRSKGAEPGENVDEGDGFIANRTGFLWIDAIDSRGGIHRAIVPVVDVRMRNAEEYIDHRASDKRPEGPITLF
jgi:hypothetical protein